MKGLLTDKRKRLLIPLSCLAFLFVTHLYRWTNAMYSHDSLLVVQKDYTWQISLGRIFNPLYVWLRGYIVAPMNVALFASVFLILSVALVVRILHLKKPLSIVLCCGFLTTFETIVFVNAGFLLSLDLDMLALLFSVLAAYFFTEKEGVWGYTAGVLALTASLGLFQSYIEVTILLICLSLLREALTGADPKKLFLKGLRCVGLLLLGGLLYYCCLRATLSITGIAAADNVSNGLVKMKALTLRKVFSLSVDAWKATLHYLFFDTMIYHKFISKWVYRILAFITFCGIGWTLWKKRLGASAVILVCFLLIVMPLGGNCVYVLSLGYKHGLMTYSFVFFSILAVLVLDLMETDETAITILRRVGPLLCAVLILNHVLFANQWYIRSDLYSRAGMSFMTRLVSDMERVDGYEVDKTPVLILGHIDESPASFDNIDFEIAEKSIIGSSHNLAISYYETYGHYFRFILGYPVNLVPLSEVAAYLDDPRYLSMPVYPAQGGVQMFDGVLVVRLSEDIRPEEFKWN